VSQSGYDKEIIKIKDATKEIIGMTKDPEKKEEFEKKIHNLIIKNNSERKNLIEKLTEGICINC